MRIQGEVGGVDLREAELEMEKFRNALSLRSTRLRIYSIWMRVLFASK